MLVLSYGKEKNCGRINFASHVDKPWLVVGDLNEVISQNDKMGGRPICRSIMDLYGSTMDACNLIDMGFNGPKFTWSNKRKRNPIFQRIDRGWANLDWLTMFPNASLWHLPRITSDHCPLLIRTDNRPSSSGLKPFRFEPMWLTHENFFEVVAQNCLNILIFKLN